MINTVLYDMDGLLLDTEPLWVICMWQIAQKHKIPIQKHQFKETTGLRIVEVTHHWSLKYPWDGASYEQVADEIVDAIIEESKQKAKVLPGIIDSLELFKSKGFKIGLASSSPQKMISDLVDYFDIKSYFNTITSADEVSCGKPHPAVFLRCAELLESQPFQCLVFEDSINGIIAAKAARMKVIAIPELHVAKNPKFSIADGQLNSMTDLNWSMIENI